MFEKVIVKKPSKSYLNGLTTSDLGEPNYDLLLKQHQLYTQALEKSNVKVNVLEKSEEFPDSTFVEDTAVLTSEFAVITNPGAESRNKEIEEIEGELQKDYDKFYYIETPGYLDGGDVLQIEHNFYVGISERTNLAGAEQLKNILSNYGYKTEVINLEETFHLKTGVSYLDNNRIVVAGELIDHPAFEKYEKIIVEPEEEYAANLIKVNKNVILPKGYSKVKEKLVDYGYKVIEVEVSEFKKHDGGVSCLSLRF